MVAEQGGLLIRQVDRTVVLIAPGMCWPLLAPRVLPVPAAPLLIIALQLGVLATRGLVVLGRVLF